MSRKFEITRVVLNQAKKLGFCEPVLPTIKKMIINSEEIDYPAGFPVPVERRIFVSDESETYTIIICNAVVCSLTKARKQKKFAEPLHYKCGACKDTKKVTVFEDCVHCDGKDSNCQFCFGKGDIKKLIACQDCSSKKRNFFK